MSGLASSKWRQREDRKTAEQLPWQQQGPRYYIKFEGKESGLHTPTYYRALDTAHYDLALYPGGLATPLHSPRYLSAHSLTAI